MPAPPPAGVSSTLRWRPMPKSRRGMVRRFHNPCAKALPVSDRPRMPGKASGNRVTMLRGPDALHLRLRHQFARAQAGGNGQAAMGFRFGGFGGVGHSSSAGGSATMRRAARSTVGTTARVKGNMRAPCPGRSPGCRRRRGCGRPGPGRARRRRCRRPRARSDRHGRIHRRAGWAGGCRCPRLPFSASASSLVATPDAGRQDRPSRDGSA